MTFNCLITGEPCVPVDKHPLIKVPGGTPSGIAFVTFNEDAFWSYGLERNENAPVSRYAAEAYTSGLTRLLDAAYPSPKDGTPLPKRNVRLSKDTTVVFWSRNASEVTDFFSEAIQADPEAVAALYSATWKGRPVRLDDPTAFYALTLSGAQGRATVRSWFESTVREVVHNVRQHFDDLRIVRPKAQEGQPFPLSKLLRSTAIRGENENIRPNLATDMFQAVMKGQRYPRILLDAAVRRVRAEREVFSARDLLPERAALIKAYLVRARRLRILASNFPEVKPMLDKDCPNTAYRLGRLFAALEKLQADATGAGTTIRDRYYGAASATPVVVFGQLLRKAPHHASKISHAPFYEKLIQEILGALRPDKAFPSTLTLEEQGLFALGYYHQRQDLFTKRTDREISETPVRGE
jgi:CRISPR-associated protein Csd1